MMRGKFILIYGSASRSCPLDKLDAAIDLVRCFVTEVLRRGGGVVVLGADESATVDSHGRPHIFDWIALREVERYVESTAEARRICARLMMSDLAVETKLNDQNLKTLSNLEQRGGIGSQAHQARGIYRWPIQAA